MHFIPSYGIARCNINMFAVPFQSKSGSPGKVILDGFEEPLEHSQIVLAVCSSQLERFWLGSSLGALHF